MAKIKCSCGRVYASKASWFTHRRRMFDKDHRAKHEIVSADQSKGRKPQVSPFPGTKAEPKGLGAGLVRFCPVCGCHLEAVGVALKLSSTVILSGARRQ